MTSKIEHNQSQQLKPSKRISDTPLSQDRKLHTIQRVDKSADNKIEQLKKKAIQSVSQMDSLKMIKNPKMYIDALENTARLEGRTEQKAEDFKMFEKMIRTERIICGECLSIEEHKKIKMAILRCLNRFEE